MPYGVQHLDTWIKDVAIIDYNRLTPQQIKFDTETIDGSFYELPKTKLIWVKLWSDTINGGYECGTMRRYTPQKWDYYSRLVGQQVKIVIEELAEKKI